MGRTNPFGDLEDFTPQGVPKPVSTGAIEEIAQASGFLSRKVRQDERQDIPTTVVVPVEQKTQNFESRPRRRRTTGRNQQINIKATEETIVTLYRIADELDLPLGAVLERALAALITEGDSQKIIGSTK